MPAAACHAAARLRMALGEGEDRRRVLERAEAPPRLAVADEAGGRLVTRQLRQRRLLRCLLLLPLLPLSAPLLPIPAAKVPAARRLQVPRVRHRRLDSGPKVAEVRTCSKRGGAVTAREVHAAADAAQRRAKGAPGKLSTIGATARNGLARLA